MRGERRRGEVRRGAGVWERGRWEVRQAVGGRERKTVEDGRGYG